MKTFSTDGPQDFGAIKAALDFQSYNSLRLLILPEDRTPEARICTLAHPRKSIPSRYLFEPENDVHEFTRVAAPTSRCRSWLIGSPARHARSKSGREHSNGSISSEQTQAAEFEASSSAGIQQARERPVSNGYLIENAEMLVATPVDYLFLILPCLKTSPVDKPSSCKRLFISADDLLDTLLEKSRHFEQILRHGKARQTMEERMEAVCDKVDAGDEKMYRLNDEKLLNELVLKAKAMVARGLPPSMEEKLVRKALENPVMVLKREASSASDANPSQTNTPTSESAPLDSVDSQVSTATSESTGTAVSLARTEKTVSAEIVPPPVPNEMYHLLRMRTALSYMISSYIPSALAVTINALLKSSQSPIDFKPLDECLASIAELRAEALASRSLGDFSRKRSIYEEDDAAETRVEKKRRKEEEEKKKKAGETRGIRELKRVDTKGMKKMSDFFGKAAAVNKK